MLIALLTQCGIKMNWSVKNHGVPWTSCKIARLLKPFMMNSHAASLQAVRHGCVLYLHNSSRSSQSWSFE